MTRFHRAFAGTAGSLAVAVLLSGTGCGDQFTDVEMHLGSESKVRPYAIVCEPPEVAPGDTVTVTLYAWTPDPASLATAWKVALDYDLGQYEADEIERRIVDLDATQLIPPPVDDGRGFVRQSFSYVVPDSALLWSSALPSPLTDESTVELARMLLPPGSDPTSKRAVEAWLRAVAPEDPAAMDPLDQAAAHALADRFACRIRFRASLHTDIHVDVTRNLTIRHSARLGGSNANRNPDVAALEVLAFPEPDIEDPDDPAHQDGLVRIPFLSNEGGVPVARVPRKSDWTYYLSMTPALQQYTSPFSGDRLFEEDATYRWYYYRLDEPGSDHALFRDDPGDETEMWALDETVRLVPPEVAGESRYRIVACLRDERPEWAMYQTTPGLTVVVGEIVFEEE